MPLLKSRGEPFGSYLLASTVHGEMHAYRSRGKSRKVKKMQDESEGAMKISALRASKQAPT